MYHHVYTAAGYKFTFKWKPVPNLSTSNRTTLDDDKEAGLWLIVDTKKATVTVEYEEDEQ